ELFDDPHLKCPGAMVEVSLADGRTTKVPALPLEMKGRRFGRRLDIPRIGEHGAAIAQELGYTPESIAALAQEGVLALDAGKGA
ncbi:MAG: CoA transferase, partial [Xanthobacteraceae bacterium]